MLTISIGIMIMLILVVSHVDGSLGHWKRIQDGAAKQMVIESCDHDDSDDHDKVLSYYLAAGKGGDFATGLQKCDIQSTMFSLPFHKTGKKKCK